MMQSFATRVGLAAAALALAVAGGLGAASLHVARDHLEREHNAQLRFDAALTAAQLSARLKAAADSLASSAAAPLFVNALVDGAGRDQYVRPFLRTFQPVEGVPSQVAVHDYQGRRVSGDAGADADWVVAVVISGHVASRLTPTADGVWTLQMAAPIIYPYTKKPEGALVYALDLSALAHSAATERQGFTVRAEARRRDAATTAVVTVGESAPVESARQTAWVAMPPILSDLRLTVECWEPLSTREAPLAALTQRYVVIGVAAVALILPLALAIARRMLRRLSALESGVRDVVRFDRMGRRFSADGGDEIAGLAGAFNHMMERLEAAYLALEQDRDQKLKLQAERHHRALALTLDGYAMIDLETRRLLELNQAFRRFVGDDAPPAVGDPAPDFLTPILDAAAARDEAGSWTAELTAGPFSLLASLSLDRPPVDHDDPQARAALFVNLTDVTENRRRQRELERKKAELERSNAELQQFAYVSSHDLQAPLRTVSSYLQLLERRLGEKLDAEGRRYLDFAVNGAQRMSQLIRDLLAFSRIGARGDPFAPVDMNALADKVLASLRGAVVDVQADITVEDLPPAVGDARQLESLLLNLLSNALKYRSPDRPCRVRLSGRREGDWLHYSVTDNGLGVAPQYFDKIFIVFQQLHPRGAYEGSGVGLALCRKVAQRHGGRIWLESVEGQGSTFHVALPVDPPPPDADAADAGAGAH